MELIDLSADLNDFADTAALIANVDLVITTCTAMAHLAGAMGKRVWVMLAFKADWRWFLDRDDSPWYPTMRLFRQTTRGEWAGVIERVRKGSGDLNLGVPITDQSQAEAIAGAKRQELKKMYRMTESGWDWRSVKSRTSCKWGRTSRARF